MLGQARHKSSGPPIHAAGTVLNNGRYRVLKKLNKGATAIVYAAKDLLTGRPVALKVVQCDSNKVPLNVVRREVSLSSTVAHENMVQLLDVFAEGTELIIVWELISGGDLLELLNECNGCMTETAAAFYYTQLLRAVLHIHVMGYCHRDIKPENCMIEASTQRLKLIDFGLSKHVESVATLGVGTPDYMPPEMVRSQMKQQQHNQQAALPYDAKAVDAWAMGVLLYLLVTGCYPFEDPRQPNNLTATLLNVQAGRCQPLPEGISAGCRGVIMGLLCPDPQRRTRLEDLAYNPWLLQSAAAHALKLGPMGSHFDPGNPAWILPAVYATAPAQPPSPPPAPVIPARNSNNSTSSTTSPLILQAASPTLLPHGASQHGALSTAAAGLAGAGLSTTSAQQHDPAGPYNGSTYTTQQQQQAWLLQQQAGGVPASFPAAVQHSMLTSAAEQRSAGGAHWPSTTAAGTPAAPQMLQTGDHLRQQLAVHSAPGVPGQPSPYAGTLSMGGQHSTSSRSFPAEGAYMPAAFAGSGMNPSGAGFTAGSAAVGGVVQGSGMAFGKSAGMQGYRAGAGYWQQSSGQAGMDGMDMDVDVTAGQVHVGGAVGMTADQMGGYGTQQLQYQQQYVQQQQQQQFGVVDSRAYGSDQDSRMVNGHEGKERRGGFNWLQSLVRKR